MTDTMDMIRCGADIWVEKIVGVKIRRGDWCDTLRLGNSTIFFYPDQMELLALAMMAYVEAQKAGRQSAEDWDAERADAEAL